ncbi:hypothetical protein OEV98_08885 [Caldibacillus lycopersici]|uniref:Uncharacterized protein n=1 Tax=Perspicuibacillus lycopersici TaxID=1325689 RepID=A0AAE3LQM5_9BACI|nr:hypothetical protein [Perspicuibacillus lycopersici]MCU9613674.1 hypothetical protein [Perspicuibacillus lycopersici]
MENQNYLLSKNEVMEKLSLLHAQLESLEEKLEIAIQEEQQRLSQQFQQTIDRTEMKLEQVEKEISMTKHTTLQSKLQIRKPAII